MDWQPLKSSHNSLLREAQSSDGKLDDLNLSIDEAD